MAKEKLLILNSRQIEQKIVRMAHHIYENHYKAKSIILVGIADRGKVLAQRIADEMEAISPIEVTVHSIAIDKDKPLNSEVNFSGEFGGLKKQVVVLVDDVLNSGRTMMYAIKYLLDAEPKIVATAILIDRFYRRFPIHADYVGLTLSTNLKEHVQVSLTKGKEAVYLED